MRLPRLQLFEFNDLPWVPAAVRDTVVESLGRALEWGRMVEGLVAPFEEFLLAAGVREVLDLGSGAGAPARLLSRAIRKQGRTSPRFLMTDLHPRLALWQEAAAKDPESIEFISSSVDATNIPPTLATGRVRTIINVLHHLPPELAASVLKDAVKGARGVFIAEGFERNPLQFANFAVAGIPALLSNPVLSPRHRIAKALLTWFSPVGLLLSFWDGVVSTLRVYSEEELRRMVQGIGDDWTWVYGTYHYPPFGTGYYFYGTPPPASGRRPVAAHG